MVRPWLWVRIRENERVVLNAMKVSVGRDKNFVGKLGSLGGVILGVIAT